jgi:hypothetical protein
MAKAAVYLPHKHKDLSTKKSPKALTITSPRMQKIKNPHAMLLTGTTTIEISMDVP